MTRHAKFIITLVAVAMISSAGVVVWMTVLSKPPATDRYVESHIDDVRLIYNPDYARFPPGRSGGHIEALEIAATFPDLKPAGSIIRSSVPGASAPDEAPIIFLSLGPVNPNVSPADRVNILYARFLEADVNETAEGLIMRRFMPASPYQGEDLYFSPPEGHSFAARCTQAATPADNLPETCIVTFRVETLDVDVRFPSTLLPQWEALSERAVTLAKSMLAR